MNGCPRAARAVLLAKIPAFIGKITKGRSTLEPLAMAAFLCEMRRINLPPCMLVRDYENLDVVSNDHVTVNNNAGLISTKNFCHYHSPLRTRQNETAYWVCL